MGVFKDCGCGCNGKRAQDKFVYSMISAVIFFSIANPATFRLMRRVLGKWVSSPNGCPSIKGLALHSVVFLLIVWGLMQVKPIEKESYKGEEGGMPGDAEDDLTDDEDDDLTDDEDDDLTDDDLSDSEDDLSDSEDDLSDSEDDFSDDEAPFEDTVEEYTSYLEGEEPPAVTKKMKKDAKSQKKQPAPAPVSESSSIIGSPAMSKKETSKLGALDLGMSDDLGAPITKSSKKSKGSGTYTSCGCDDGSKVKILR